EDAGAIHIETPEGTDALTEFVLFHDRVYASRPARWSAFLPLDLPILAGESPFVEGRRVRPFVARAGGEIVARAAAVVDSRYNRHWRERLGHIVMFEALPAAREATRLLLDAACEWLAGEGTEAARAGFGMLEFPFVIDAYDALPAESLGRLGMLDLSLIAYEGARSVGVLWVLPEISSTAALAPGHALTDAEKLNFLGIGVREVARGRGVNMAMAGHAYLELVRRGARYLSYTIVLDDNWPSRRTAAKLGAEVCASYVVYRRNFRR